MYALNFFHNLCVLKLQIIIATVYRWKRSSVCSLDIVRVNRLTRLTFPTHHECSLDILYLLLHHLYLVEVFKLFDICSIQIFDSWHKWKYGLNRRYFQGNVLHLILVVWHFNSYVYWFINYSCSQFRIFNFLYKKFIWCFFRTFLLLLFLLSRFFRPISFFYLTIHIFMLKFGFTYFNCIFYNIFIVSFVANYHSFWRNKTGRRALHVVWKAFSSWRDWLLTASPAVEGLLVDAWVYVLDWGLLP